MAYPCSQLDSYRELTLHIVPFPILYLDSLILLLEFKYLNYLICEAEFERVFFNLINFKGEGKAQAAATKAEMS